VGEVSVVQADPLVFFRQELRRRRRELGLSIRQLADRAGLTREAISCVERGTRYPWLSTALKLAEALDCTILDLCGA
jgi:putative molybdopterin biosynthesis protein